MFERLFAISRASFRWQPNTIKTQKLFRIMSQNVYDPQTVRHAENNIGNAQ